MQPVLEGNLFNIYLRIFKFLKEKINRLFFSILVWGTISKLSTTLGTLLLRKDQFPKNILDKAFLMQIFLVF